MPTGMLSVTTAQPVEQAATIRYPGYRLLRLPTFKQDATGESVLAYLSRFLIISLAAHSQSSQAIVA